MKNDKVINRLGCQYCLAPIAQHFSCCVSPPLSWCRLLLRKLSFFAGSFCDVVDRASSTDPVPSKPFFAIEQGQSSGDRASQRRRSAQTVMMLARDSETRHPFSAEPTREILSSLRESLVSHNDVDCYQQLHSCSHCRTN